MTDKRHKHARDEAARGDAGLDVLLPLLAVLIAAIVLLMPARSAEAPPRPIYDAHRFAMTEAERTALEVHTAELASIEADRAAARHVSHVHTRVEVAALPPIPATPHVTPRNEVRMAADAGPARPPLIAAPLAAAPGWSRLAIALAIAALLGGALVMLDRTWRRTSPAASPAAA